jgi:hypothetical protein
MGLFSKSVILFAILLTPLGASAQTTKASVWAVDFVKTKAGEQENYLKFVEQNWAKARSFMKDKGIVADYRVVSAPAADKAQWDVLLMTEYVDQAGYERREAVFEEFRKSNPAVPVGGKNSREMSEIKFNRLFNQPISKEVAEIMLKTQSDDLETAALRLPLENYLRGHATGDGEFHRKAFYPESRLLFVREGKLAQRTSADYIKGSSGKAADDEAQRRRWIETVDVSGSAAIGKIVLDYPTAYFVDYFALLKIDGEWKIVNKSFHVQPRKTPDEKIGFRMTDEDKRAAAAPIENYIKAHATGNGEFIRQAFHAEAKIMSFGDGKFSQLSVEEFAARFKGAPAADEDKRKRSFEIVDVAGNAALAKVVLDYPTVKFTDYMTLLKIDGEWKIINKTFHSEAKGKK